MISAASVIPGSSTPSTHDIACMEVWGGNHAFSGCVSVPGNDVTVSCTPHIGGDRGGDIYYVSSCAAGIITRFVLADVSGHGEQVAALAHNLRRQMRKHINTADQTRFAIALNEAFAGLSADGRFATALLLTYFAPSDHLILCNAGHPRPLLYRAAVNRWERLDSRATGAITARAEARNVGISNLPLGILDPTDYEQFAIKLDKGDLVLLYSDAFIEAPDANARQLGEDGLLALAQGLSADDRRDAPAALARRVREHTRGLPLDDDATMILLTHTGSDPPPLSWAGQAGKFAKMLGLGAIDSGPGHDS